MFHLHPPSRGESRGPPPLRILVLLLSIGLVALLEMNGINTSSSTSIIPDRLHGNSWDQGMNKEESASLQLILIPFLLLLLLLLF